MLYGAEPLYLCGAGSTMAEAKKPFGVRSHTLVSVICISFVKGDASQDVFLDGRPFGGGPSLPSVNCSLATLRTRAKEVNHLALHGVPRTVVPFSERR